ncbi:GNAT family N-acetyltransferase [Arthrobacter sp. TMN-49]
MPLTISSTSLLSSHLGPSVAVAWVEWIDAWHSSVAPSNTPGLLKLRTTWPGEQASESLEDSTFEVDYRSWEANNPRTMFISELDGALVGMLNLMVFDRMPKPGKKSTCWIYLGNAFVEVEHRGLGTGSRLMDGAIRFSQDIHAARIVLSPSDESQTFYARHRFEPAEEFLVKRLEYKRQKESPENGPEGRGRPGDQLS